jgi:CHAT domain-containing protein/tetratricopeptide (TPR) repeat protein
VRLGVLIALPIALCVSVAVTVAQPSDVDARLKELDAQYDTRDRRETLKLVEPILALPDLTRAQRVDALRIKGNAETAVGSNDKSVETLTLALATAGPEIGPRLKAQLLLSMATAYRGLKQLDAAMARSLAAEEIITSLGDDELLLECLAGRMYYIDDNDGSKAQQIQALADRALPLAAQLKRPGVSGRIYHSLADDAFSNGNYGDAVRLLELAVTNLRLAGPGDRNSLGRALTSLGRARRAHGLPARALDAYREAMAVQQQTGDRFGVVQSWNAMGVAYGHLEQPDKSLECYRNGLEEARILGDPSAIQFMEGAVATALGRLGRHEEAIPILEGILARNPEPFVARFRMGTLAEDYLAVGRAAEALALVDKAVKAEARINPDAEATLIYLRARANARLGNQDAAIADGRATLAIYEKVRESLLPLDFVKRGYSDSIQDIFDFTIGALDEAGRHPEAVEAAEAARGRALADLLASRMQPKAPGGASDSGAAALLTGGAPQADAAPAGLDSPIATRALSASELASLAAAHGTTILSYWVGPDRTLAWVIRGTGEIVPATVTVTRARLQQLVDQASRAPVIAVEGAAGKPDSAERALRTLYDVLIAPVEAVLPAPGARLTIVPHGPLFSLSFGALENRRGHYLIERYAIHDVPSGAVLALAASRPVSPGRDWLLVADPQPRPRAAAALAPLPGASREIAAAAAVAPANAVTRLTGAGASEPAFRARLADARVIHVAAHAVVPERDTANAFLAFGRAATVKSDEGDGRVTAAEIYDMHVGADLVVLSACRSGRGRITGDGVAGFTRAFMSAGARTVVASLWDAPDETARRLMSRFYRRFAGGDSTAEALRAAQLSLLAELRAGKVSVKSPAGDVVLPPHPALWAGFRVHGLP